MKIIDLLNKIANEGVSKFPIHIRYYNRIYEEFDICLFYLDTILDKLLNEVIDLNDKIEIIEDTPKEEKKIPGKLDLYEETQNIIRENNYKLVYHDIHKCIISLECKYNQLLDYLKSKGE